MKKREMCSCSCHVPGFDVLHCMPCCDFTYQKRTSIVKEGTNKMEKNWDKWYQEAIDHLDCHHGKLIMSKSDSFEQLAWRGWSSGQTAIEFIDDFVGSSTRWIVNTEW